ncbi:MAG TPA: plastocyanin/azurin family copper-binding protein [Acidimicrobiales bacterium]|nr:plastocyanin/azurin family copper-binding protein [Acidimicrobiales bacterium]
MTADTQRSGRARPLAFLGALVAVAVAIPVGIASAGHGTPPPPAGPVTIRITAYHSRFLPASVEVAPGARVRFVIRNADPIDHEFIVGGPEVHRRHEVGREAHHHGEVPGEISVPAGATVETVWTAPSEPGPLTYACHLPGHFAYGMAGTVHVAL